MVEEKVGSNNLTSDGEFEGPGSIYPPAAPPPKPTERFMFEMEGAWRIVKNYFDTIYYFGPKYPPPPDHKQADEALKRLGEYIQKLK